MRSTLLLSAAVLGLAMAAPAFAQTSPSDQSSDQSSAPMTAPKSGMIRPGHVPGVGPSYPASSQASNIDRADARSTIAPRLPTPKVADNATPDAYLGVAKRALKAHRTGEAQEALERAQTRLLDRSVAPDQANQPATDPRVAMIQNATQALAHGNTARADHLITEAMAQTSGSGTGMMSGSGMSNPGMSSPGMSSPGTPGVTTSPNGTTTTPMTDGTTAPNGTPVTPGTSGTTGGTVQP